MLSSCRGISNDFIKIFFSKGGKALIYSSSKIISEHQDKFFNALYWNFLYRKISLGESFKAAKFKISGSSLNWGKFHIAGDINIKA